MLWCSSCHGPHAKADCPRISKTIYVPSQDPTLPERFWKFVKKSDGCWLWTGGVFHDGYGQVWAKDKRYVRAHRASWLIHFGDIPEEMQVCHHCDVPACVRPDHLFLGTSLDNSRDAVSKGRMSQGEKHYKAKLCSEDVKDILVALRANTTKAELARRYGVSEGCIFAIAKGQSWKALGLPMPLETPSHSGAYQGTCPVRVLAPGESFQPDTGPLEINVARQKKQSVTARLNATFCKYDRCHKILSPDPKKRRGYYCNHTCFDRQRSIERGRKQLNKLRARTKWG